MWKDIIEALRYTCFKFKGVKKNIKHYARRNLRARLYANVHKTRGLEKEKQTHDIVKVFTLFVYPSHIVMCY